jgi:hypothetical protein
VPELHEDPPACTIVYTRSGEGLDGDKEDEMSKASEKRYAAINALSESVRSLEVTDEGREVVWHKGENDRAEVAAMIRDLAPLGRTDRWKTRIAQWAEAVETEAAFQWAFDQYGIWACYAAE